ncbi:MAG: hypothetical protein NC400_14730 [Clostridium sp.]|nr:hypothetical protein [Clostridium sp.]
MKLNQTLSLKIAGFFHALLLFWTFYPFTACILQMNNRRGVSFCLTGVLLLIPVILSFYGIKKIKYLIPYLLFGILCSLLFGALGGFAASAVRAEFYSGGILAFVLSLLIFLIRSYSRIKKGQLQKALKEMPVSDTEKLDMGELEAPVFLEVPHPLHWIFFAVHYVAGALLKSSLYWHMIFYLFLADVFLCFAYQFAENFYRFLREHERSANLPVPTMKKVLKIIFGMACLILLLFVLPSLLYGKEPLSAITPKEYELPLELPEMEEPAAAELSPGMEGFFLMDEEPKEPPLWLQHLFTLCFYLLSLTIGVLILVMIYRACKRAGEFFADQSEDEIQFLEKSFSDRNFFLKKAKDASAPDLSVNLKIRKYYKKTLRKALKNSPKGSETPFELETAAKLPENQNRLLLHASYEKARYSNLECTQEELHALKAAKQLQESP